MSLGKQKYSEDAGFPEGRSGPMGSESLGDPEPFSRVISGPREQTGKSTKLPQLKAAILGPPGTGKSSFIAALQQSLIVEPSDVVRRFVPQPASASNTRRRSGAVPASEETAEASAETNAGKFYVELAQPPGAIELVIYDSDGDHVSQAHDDNSLNPAWFTKARSAQLLLLCVDTNEIQRDYWRLALDQVVRDLEQQQEDLAPDESSAELGAILPVSRSLRGGALCTSFRRVLFLLSRVDLLFETAQSGHGFLKRMAALEPRHLARSLDPVPQLCSLLGTTTVGKVLHSLQEDVEVAVGVVSAKGLGSISGLFHAQVCACPETLGEWHPFGVREALEFLTSGRCAAPVVPLSRSDLGQSHFIRLL